MLFTFVNTIVLKKALLSCFIFIVHPSPLIVQYHHALG